MASIKSMNQQAEKTEASLRSLIGRKITGIVRDDTFTSRGAIFGLELDDGSLVFILSDPAGNGPGHLYIQKQSRTKGAP